MAEVKYIKIPTDFFDREPISSLEEMPDGSTLIVLYLELLFESYQEGGKGTISVCNIVLTDQNINAILRQRYSDIGEKLQVLEAHGLISRKARSIQVFKFWADKHNRNSDSYKQWRKAVYKRDCYVCQNCGTKKDLQAHHIKPWQRYPDLRYEVENGITLCRKCHLKAHGGCWKNG